MTLSIDIPPDVEARLKARASASGQDLAGYVSRLVTHFAEPPLSLEELSGPIHQKFLESGMSEDDLVDLLERAKHEMRAERRAKQGR